MADFIFLMHNDADRDEDDSAWGPYLGRLKQAGRFDGGSAIGAGTCARKHGKAPAIVAHLSGYIRIQADDLEQAKSLLAGNPTYEAGGTVEIRELPRS